MKIDFPAMAWESLSHDPDELRAAVEGDQVVWALDTSGYGADDILIYDAGIGEEEIRDEVLRFLRLGEYAEHSVDRVDPFGPDASWPWTLERLTPQEMERQWPEEEATANPGGVRGALEYGGGEMSTLHDASAPLAREMVKTGMVPDDAQSRFVAVYGEAVHAFRVHWAAKCDKTGAPVKHWRAVVEHDFVTGFGDEIDIYIARGRNER